MNGNVSTVEGLKQCCELVGSVAKAMALVAPNMSKEQRQSLIGMPPADLAHVLEQALFSSSNRPDGLSWFSRNRHGHIVFKMSGGCEHLTGEWVVENGGRDGHIVTSKARSCLLSNTANSFNKLPQLRAFAVPYEVVLMPVRETEYLLDRKMKSLRKNADREYGYRVPPAGMLPLLFMDLTKEQLVETGFEYIGSSGVPIEDEVGTPHQFSMRANQSGLYLDATIETTNSLWNPGGALLFLTS